MTTKQINGYLRAARMGWLNGITFNDGYNVPTFGITLVDYQTIDRAMRTTYGSDPKLSPSGVRAALKGGR